jgi:hypothetical protein
VQNEKEEQKKQINKRKNSICFSALGSKKRILSGIINGVWMSRSASSKKKRAALRR